MIFPNRPKIYTNAFPKCGVTWLVHLLCDLFKAPQTGVELVTPLYWGDTNEKYQVIKQHVQLKDIKTDGTIILSIRDPRDVIVSKHFYNTGDGSSLEGQISVVCKWYQIWYTPWLQSRKYDYLTSYEKLHSNPFNELLNIARIAKIKVSPSDISGAINRQSFENMKPTMDKIRVGFLRKGTVGDWKNYFTRDNAKQIHDCLGDFMIDLGYIDNLNWWKGV